MIKVRLLLVVALAVIAGCKYDQAAESVAPLSDGQRVLLEFSCAAAPGKAELLNEKGELALFAGETAEDSAFNKAGRESNPDFYNFRNSLFLRRRRADGTDEWRVLLTTGSDWRAHDGMDKWCSGQADDLRRCFFVDKASFSTDGRHLWLVCDTHTSTYHVVCSYDVYDCTFRVLIDGYTAIEEPDGTILVKDKKFYPGDDLGAAWHDVWITPDGKVVRESKITLRGSDL